MADALLLCAALGAFLMFLAVAGAIAEWWDPIGERRDARRRNGR